MMLQNNPQSRFQLIQTPILAPGSCVTCGGSQGPFIDFGFLSEFYGAVIFCVSCARDCGRSAGLIDRPTVVESAAALPNWVPSILNDYEADVNAAMAKLRNCFNADATSVLPSVEINGESEEESGESESSDSKELRVASSNSKSISSEGSDGVSSTSEQ
jgi:hypothetical protein